jgi:hypothetical protein
MKARQELSSGTKLYPCASAGNEVGYTPRPKSLPLHSPTPQLEAMADQFEPLQNDLIIRTAWGKVRFSLQPDDTADIFEARKSSDLPCG